MTQVVGSGDLVSALVVHYAMQLYVLHTAMYWADTCQVAKVQLTVGFRRNKYAYQLGWTEMYPHRQNFARIKDTTTVVCVFLHSWEELRTGPVDLETVCCCWAARPIGLSCDVETVGVIGQFWRDQLNQIERIRQS